MEIHKRTLRKKKKKRTPDAGRIQVTLRQNKSKAGESPTKQHVLLAPLCYYKEGRSERKRAERCSQRRQEVKDPRAEHSTEGRGEGSFPRGSV